MQQSHLPVEEKRTAVVISHTPPLVKEGPHFKERMKEHDRLCVLVVRVLDYRCRGPGFDSRYYQKKKVVGLERGPLSLVSTTEELLDRKVAAPV
jgi:hypothetical protein